MLIFFVRKEIVKLRVFHRISAFSIRIVVVRRQRMRALNANVTIVDLVCGDIARDKWNRSPGGGDRIRPGAQLCVRNFKTAHLISAKHLMAAERRSLAFKSLHSCLVYWVFNWFTIRFCVQFNIQQRVSRMKFSIAARMYFLFCFRIFCVAQRRECKSFVGFASLLLRRNYNFAVW